MPPNSSAHTTMSPKRNEYSCGKKRGRESVACLCPHHYKVKRGEKYTVVYVGRDLGTGFTASFFPVLFPDNHTGHILCICYVRTKLGQPCIKRKKPIRLFMPFGSHFFCPYGSSTVVYLSVPGRDNGPTLYMYYHRHSQLSIFKSRHSGE